jgi:hypothetical protein
MDLESWIASLEMRSRTGKLRGHMSNIGETLMSGRMAAKSLKSYSQVLATMQRTLLLLKGANARRPGQFGIYPGAGGGS